MSAPSICTCGCEEVIVLRAKVEKQSNEISDLQRSLLGAMARARQSESQRRLRRTGKSSTSSSSGSSSKASHGSTKAPEQKASSPSKASEQEQALLQRIRELENQLKTFEDRYDTTQSTSSASPAPEPSTGTRQDNDATPFDNVVHTAPDRSSNSAMAGGNTTSTTSTTAMTAHMGSNGSIDFAGWSNFSRSNAEQANGASPSGLDSAGVSALTPSTPVSPWPAALRSQQRRSHHGNSRFRNGKGKRTYSDNDAYRRRSVSDSSAMGKSSALGYDITDLPADDITESLFSFLNADAQPFLGSPYSAQSPSPMSGKATPRSRLTSDVSTTSIAEHVDPSAASAAGDSDAQSKSSQLSQAGFPGDSFNAAAGLDVFGGKLAIARSYNSMGAALARLISSRDLNRQFKSLLARFVPSSQSEHARAKVVGYVQGLIKGSLGAQLYQHGCGALKTYLPDDPIHISAFFSRGHENTWVQRIVTAVCQEAGNPGGSIDADAQQQQDTSEAAPCTPKLHFRVVTVWLPPPPPQQQSDTNPTSSASGDTAADAQSPSDDSTAVEDQKDMHTTNTSAQSSPVKSATKQNRTSRAHSMGAAVSVHSGRVGGGGNRTSRSNSVADDNSGGKNKKESRGRKRGAGAGGSPLDRIVGCRINGMNVIISGNQVHSLSMLAFIEEADRVNDRSHLLKRTILLTKLWARRVGLAHREDVLPQQRTLSDQCIHVMVLTVFNAVHQFIFTPLEGLCAVITALMEFDWGRDMWDLNGPLPKSDLASVEQIPRGKLRWPASSFAAVHGFHPVTTAVRPLLSARIILKYRDSVINDPLATRVRSPSDSPPDQPTDSRKAPGLSPLGAGVDGLATDMVVLDPLRPRVSLVADLSSLQQKRVLTTLRQATVHWHTALVELMRVTRGHDFSKLTRQVFGDKLVQTPPSQRTTKRRDAPSQELARAAKPVEHTQPRTQSSSAVQYHSNPLHTSSSLTQSVSSEVQFHSTGSNHSKPLDPTALLPDSLVMDHFAPPLTDAQNNGNGVGGGADASALPSGGVGGLFSSGGSGSYPGFSSSPFGTGTLASPPLGGLGDVVRRLSVTTTDSLVHDSARNVLSSPDASVHAGLMDSSGLSALDAMRGAELALGDTGTSNGGVVPSLSPPPHPVNPPLVTGTSSSLSAQQPVDSPDNAQASSSTSATTAVPVKIAEDPLHADLDAISGHLSHAKQFQTPDISEIELVKLVANILYKHGAVPVGRMGSLLHTVTNNHSLPSMIKERYGGLKRFLESHADTFAVAADHPYNPTVSLRGQSQNPEYHSAPRNNRSGSRRNRGRKRSGSAPLKPPPLTNYSAVAGGHTPNGNKGFSKQTPGGPSLPLLSLKCQLVGIGPHDSLALARCTIVNGNGEVAYDKYVKRTEPITDYRGHSGSLRMGMRQGTDSPTVQLEVTSVVRGHVLVGHCLHKDLKALGIFHPPTHIRDVAFYPGFPRNASTSLKVLVAERLGRTIQSGPPDSIEDARAALMLYRSVQNEWESSLAQQQQHQTQQQQKHQPVHWGNRNGGLPPTGRPHQYNSGNAQLAGQAYAHTHSPRWGHKQYHSASSQSSSGLSSPLIPGTPPSATANSNMYHSYPQSLQQQRYRRGGGGGSGGGAQQGGQRRKGSGQNKSYGRRQRSRGQK